MGLAGVMGGAASEVTDATTDILLEGAHFDRLRVRVAAKALGMHTDASHRFERGTDPEGCLDGVSRAAALMAEMAGGTVLAGGLDVRAEEFPPVRTGRLDLARLGAFAGAEIAAADVERWLTGLGFTLARDRRWSLADSPLRPGGCSTSSRARSGGGLGGRTSSKRRSGIYGMDNIESTLPRVLGLDAPKPRSRSCRERVRDYLAAAGYVETVHFAFGDPAGRRGLSRACARRRSRCGSRTRSPRAIR